MTDDEDSEPGGETLSAVAEGGGRLDKTLASVFPQLSRTRLKTLILGGEVTVDGEPRTDPSGLIKAGQLLGVSVPAPVPHHPEPESIPLNIVYEDDHLLVVDKQGAQAAGPHRVLRHRRA